MSGIYQLKVDQNSVTAPDANSVFLSIDLNGKLFTIDDTSDIQEYARMSDLSNITGGTYNSGTNELTLDNSTGGTVTITGFTAGSGIFIEDSGPQSTLRIGAGVASDTGSTVSGGGGQYFGNMFGQVCLPNIACGNYSTIGGGSGNIASGGHSTIGGGGCTCFIPGCIGNTASGCTSTIGGGGFNTASGDCSTIGGGRLNTASGCQSTIGGGSYNTASGCYTGILGGRDNSTNNCNCAMIVGSCITADRECATFVNNLSIKNIPTSSAGLPSGSVWSDSGVLKIVT
jgi:hypothetical protein